MINKTNFQANQKREEVFENTSANVSFRCLYATAESFIGGSFPWHWHSAFEIDYVSGSDTRFDFAGASFDIPAGGAIFINSGEIHSYQPVCPDECKIYAILFEPVFLAGEYLSLIHI